MDFESIPFQEIRNAITLQVNPRLAFNNILQAAKKNCPTLDWQQFSMQYMETDIAAAAEWIKKTLRGAPDAKGLYFGLDTLNMEGGEGSNVEIGINTSCDPSEISADWAFDCETYENPHLIKGLYLVFSNFIGPEDDDKGLAEYVVFLSYSGLVIREALLKAEVKNDFISCWGFHDGDLFLLMNRIGQHTTMLANIELE